MACVLFNELSEANIVCAQAAESIQDTGFTGMEKWKVLWHLQEKKQAENTGACDSLHAGLSGPSNVLYYLSFPFSKCPFKIGKF